MCFINDFARKETRNNHIKDTKKKKTHSTFNENKKTESCFCADFILF